MIKYIFEDIWIIFEPLRESLNEGGAEEQKKKKKKKDGKKQTCRRARERERQREERVIHDVCSFATVLTAASRHELKRREESVEKSVRVGVGYGHLS